MSQLSRGALSDSYLILMTQVISLCQEMKRLWIPQTVASVMLFWALNPENPYGFYVILRWVCCGVFGFLAFHARAHEMQGWCWTLGITALLYNPIFPVHLTREIWSVVNIVTVGIAIVSIFRLPVQEG